MVAQTVEDTATKTAKANGSMCVKYTGGLSAYSGSPLLLSTQALHCSLSAVLSAVLDCIVGSVWDLVASAGSYEKVFVHLLWRFVYATMVLTASLNFAVTWC